MSVFSCPVCNTFWASDRSGSLLTESQTRTCPVCLSAMQGVEKDPAPSPAVQFQPLPVQNASRSIWQLVIEDMKAREVFGMTKYRTPLQVGNGRDSLVDAYQEALDLCVYLRQEIEGRRQHGSVPRM